MKRLSIVAPGNINDHRANVCLLSARSRSNYFSDLRQCWTALVRIGVCARVYLQLSHFALAGQTRVCRSTRRTSWRLYHGLRTFRCHHRRSARLRFFLQTGNAARAVIDPAGVGRRNVEPRRDAWGLALYPLLFLSAQNLVDEPGDNLVVTAPLGLFFGRCANFINGELYGRITNVPWAMQFPKELLDHPAEADRAIATCTQIDPSLTTPDAIISAVRGQPQVATALRSILTPRHPSQLYEAFFEGIVLFAILWFVRTRIRQSNGVLTGLFFILYAVFRIVIEYFREPDATLIGPFTRGQFFSFFLIAIGVGFVTAAKMRPTFPKGMTKHA